MTQSTSYNYTTNRDGIIKRAYRIIDAIGEGEDPTPTQITEGSEALNDLVKEWAAEGMPLWAIKTSSAITLVSGTTSYSIGVGATVNQNAPLKIYYAWLRDINTNFDTPMLVIPRKSYELLATKTQLGVPNQLWYNPPPGIAVTENAGTITLYVTPDTYTAANKRLYFSGQYPFMDFDAAADVPDFPQYWFNAVKWGLADQLAYQNSVGIAERSMITKKALYHKEMAMSFNPEEGSYEITIQPSWNDR